MTRPAVVQLAAREHFSPVLTTVNAWVDAWTPKPKAKAKLARKRKSS